MGVVPHQKASRDSTTTQLYKHRYNCALREAEDTVFKAAQEHNTGVVIMNASARGGASADVKDLSTADGAPPEEDFYRYVRNPREHFRSSGCPHLRLVPR